VLLEQAATADSRFRLIRQAANTGIVAALNRGLDECRAPYVARMDADDIARPDRFERQAAHLMEPDIVAWARRWPHRFPRKSSDRVRRCALGIDAAEPLLHPTVAPPQRPGSMRSATGRSTSRRDYFRG
jgi:glycosyltransferase involved in cell wall biosynthesis